MNNINFENKLEVLLRKAAIDSGYRPQFYKELINSKVCVLVKNSLGESQNNYNDISIVNLQDENGNNIIPIFSSVMQIKKTVKNAVNYIIVDAKTFFYNTLGETLVLNPMSDYGKELLPNEIKSLLNGTIFDVPPTITLKKGEHIFIGQPEVFPREVVKQLKILLSQESKIDFAYIAQVFGQKPDDKSHLVVALKGHGDLTKIIADAAMVVRAVIDKDEYVDFVSLDQDDEISTYMKELEPFYRR